MPRSHAQSLSHAQAVRPTADKACAARAPHGFTLIELMVVVVILGLLLGLVPANIAGWGGRARLEGAANSLVAAIAAAKHQAIMDGYQAHLELGIDKDDAQERYGLRIRFTNQPARVQAQGDDEQAELARRQREQEREWLDTGWHHFKNGVEISGVSTSKGNWEKVRGDRPFVITFAADGSVLGAAAVRVENMDLDVKREFRTATVIINALTSDASWADGEQELPAKRPASDFGG